MKSKYIQLVILLFLSSFALPSLANEKAKQAVISAYDAISIPGLNIELKAKLERDRSIPLRRNISKEVLGFYIKDRLIGTVTTDRKGIASLVVAPAYFSRGIQNYEVKLLNSRSFQARPATALVTVWEKDQRIIVTDIDKTISDNSSLDVIRVPYNRQPAFDGARDYLTRMRDDGIGIVYLTAREDVLLQLSKNWLDHLDFPKGHLYLWDLALLPSRTPWNHGAYKSLRMKKLKSFFPNILAAYGDKIHDLEAYHEHGVPAFFFRSDYNRNEVIPSWAHEFEHWHDL